MTDYPRERLELIVCDDASPPSVRMEIRTFPFDVFVLGNRRLGLGGNTNRGLKVATGDFILQLQDDWECVGPPSYLKDALSVLLCRSDVGMVICRPHPSDLPGTKEVHIGGLKVRVFANNPDKSIAKVGQHAYTDWPHLKRRAFHEDIGLYREDLEMWQAELDFSQRVNAQARHLIADMGMDAFRHIGEELSFNTGGWRAQLGRAIAKAPGGHALLTAVQNLRRNRDSKR